MYVRQNIFKKYFKNHYYIDYVLDRRSRFAIETPCCGLVANTTVARILVKVWQTTCGYYFNWNWCCTFMCVETKTDFLYYSTRVIS